MIGPSTHSLIILALSSPHARRYTFLAPRIVDTPIVIELIGVFSIVPNILVASLRELLSSKIRRVVEFRREPGSLKAILPTRPIPRRAMSIPPKLSIRCSYRRQYSRIVSLAMVPSGVNTFCLSMSTWSRNISFKALKLLLIASRANG